MSVTPRPHWRQRAGLATAAGLFGLAMGNAALEVARHPYVTQGWIPAALRGQRIDWRRKLTVVADLRRAGRSAYPAYVPQHALGAEEKLHGLLPLGGIARVPTVACNENGRWLVYESDRYGFNNDDAVYDAGGPSVLLLGDSYTQGFCVQPDENVAARLRQAGHRAISLGMNGNGPLLELATVQEYGAPLRPRTILWLYFEDNDLINLGAEARDPFLAHYLQGPFTQGLARRQPEIDAALAAYIERVTRDGSHDFWAVPNVARRLLLLSRVRELVGLTRAHVHQLPREPLDRELALLRATWVRGQAIARELTADLVLVYLPDISQLSRGALPSRDRVLRLARQLGLRVVDFYPILAADPDPLRLVPCRAHSHYTAEGYALLAEMIDRELRDRPTLAGHSTRKGAL